MTFYQNKYLKYIFNFFVNNKYMIQKLLTLFVLGGILFSSIYYIANVVKNPVLAAILAVFPISLVSCFIIKEVSILKKYCQNMAIILLLTAISLLLLILMLNCFKINPTYLIVLTILLWMAMMYVKIQYYD
tara:strand:- start:893 stop:1285 length:393 start_codon:yes stop_codon:yes gene_type:complete